MFVPISKFAVLAVTPTPAVLRAFAVPWIKLSLESAAAVVVFVAMTSKSASLLLLLLLMSLKSVVHVLHAGNIKAR